MHVFFSRRFNSHQPLGVTEARYRVTRPSALIFDMDGVLVDTMPHHNRSWQLLAEQEGLRLELRHLESLRGLGRRDSLLTLLGDRALLEEQMQHLLAEKNRLFLRLIGEVGPKHLLPGALPLLEEATAAGLPLGLASSSRNARFLCDNLGIRPFFQAFADGTDVARGKPAPDLYVRVVGELGVPAARCLVLEDGAAGVRAAQAAGCRVVGLGPRERLGEADAVLEGLASTSLAELLELL